MQEKAGQQWRKDELSSGKQKPKYKFVTVDELRKSGKTSTRRYTGANQAGSKVAKLSSTSELSKVKVIDMTSKQTKVFSGLVIRIFQNNLINI